ncbi:MAG TPA: hypothetical protein VL326_21335 [Kofleriaceae bacterium]|nr:hypothetical protein [Kofleriaceae bacterium]
MSPQRVGDNAVNESVTTVQILVSVDGGAATDRPTYARKDQTVTLYALLRTNTGSYTDAPLPQLSGKRIQAQPISKAPAVQLAWTRIEPATANMSNTQSGSFKFEPIEYVATAIDNTANKSSIAADVRPTLTTDHGDGIGTMRYQLLVTRGDQTIASPGIDARRGRGSGGLTDAVTRVTIRRDDTFLGYLTEMYGQPYIWASAGLSDTSHESERLEGSDCADLMVYGARRMGKKVAYTWTGGLPSITKLVAGSGTRGEDGIYRDKAGKPLPFTGVGDLVLFPRHVGALAEDRGTKGVLDDQDIMVHTLFDSPKEQAIADSGYADTSVELRRWK